MLRFPVWGKPHFEQCVRQANPFSLLTPQWPIVKAVKQPPSEPPNFDQHESDIQQKE